MAAFWPSMLTQEQAVEIRVMARMAAEWPALAQQAAREEASFADFLEKLLHASQPRASSASARRC